jgi:hypothetical protein
MMHHAMLFQHLSSKPHAKDKHGRAEKALFCRKIMEACETKEHGHDSKQRHQVEGPIIQEKEWMREFGRCNSWSTLAQRSQSEDECAGRNRSQGGHEATQDGRPRLAGLPLLSAPGAPLWQVSSSSNSLFVCSNLLSRTTLDLAILPKFVFPNKSHPKSTQSQYSEIIFVFLVTG